MLEVGTAYRITSPAIEIGQVRFEDITQEYIAVDEQEYIPEMDKYQLSLITRDDYHAFLDKEENLVLLKITPEHIVEEI